MLNSDQVRQMFNQKFQDVMGRGATDADFQGQAAAQNYTGQPISLQQLNNYFDQATQQYNPGYQEPAPVPSRGPIPIDPGGIGRPAPVAPPSNPPMVNGQSTNDLMRMPQGGAGGAYPTGGLPMQVAKTAMSSGPSGMVTGPVGQTGQRKQQRQGQSPAMQGLASINRQSYY